MRWIFGAIAVLMMSPQVAAAEAKYIYTNHRLDYIKLESLSGKELAEKSPTHPVTISTAKMRDILASLKLSRRLVFKNEAESQDIFNDRAVTFLAPRVAEAFQRAESNEIVVFSYLWKNPELIMRNDRFTVAKAWVKDNEMHIEFLKLHAKLTGDTDKKGGFDKIVNRAKSLRIELEPQAGQMLGASNAHELIVDLKQAIATRAPEAAPTVAPPVDNSMKARLQELEKLHRSKLINDEEYQAKRRELLKSL